MVARYIWKAVALIWIIIWSTSFLQIGAAILRAYTPVGIVLTPSAMPDLWPLSVVVIVPADHICQYGDGYYVYYLDAKMGAISHVPFVHYVSCGEEPRMVINGKASLDKLPKVSNPVDALLAPVRLVAWFINAMMPPYPYLILPAPTRNIVGYVVAYLDGRATILLWASVLIMPPLVYRLRRVL